MFRVSFGSSSVTVVGMTSTAGSHLPDKGPVNSANATVTAAITEILTIDLRDFDEGLGIFVRDFK